VRVPLAQPTMGSVSAHTTRSPRVVRYLEAR
jgi:hypothetical protein